MAAVEKSIEVGVPVRAAYKQWTQFEEFPRFMEGVKEIKRIDDSRLHWKADVAGVEREWDTRITEQKPDMRIAWTSEDGAEKGRVVTFHKLDDNRTKVMLQLEFEPDELVEEIGDKLGFVSRRTSDDLKRFKAFIEDRS